MFIAGICLNLMAAINFIILIIITFFLITFLSVNRTGDCQACCFNPCIISIIKMRCYSICFCSLMNLKGNLFIIPLAISANAIIWLVCFQHGVIRLHAPSLYSSLITLANMILCNSCFQRYPWMKQEYWLILLLFHLLFVLLSLVKLSWLLPSATETHRCSQVKNTT